VVFDIAVSAEAGILANAVRIDHAALPKGCEEALPTFCFAAIYSAGIVIIANLGWVLAPFQGVAGINGAGVIVVTEEVLG
jgi:hypothetical protein